MIRVVEKYPGMRMFRATGRPRLLPVSMAYSVTHRCNCRCKTCGLGAAGTGAGELSLEEWKRVFSSLGNSPVWVTVTGGEPFLRDDFMELGRAMVDASKPRYVNIVTNGTLVDRASLMLPLLAREHPETRFIANISLDGIGPAHDRIRGLNGCFDSALETFHALRRKKPRNLHVGFHTTISKYNIGAIRDIIVYVKAFKPDAHIFEIAQQRAELKMKGKDIAPPPEMYRELVPDLIAATCGEDITGTTRRARHMMREMYYELSAEVAEKKRQPVPCFAGFSSAQVGPTGDVWACCMAAEPMGNLREADFNFLSVWHSAQAEKVRAPIARGRCHCEMSNAMFNSMVFHPSSFASMASKFAASYFSFEG